MAFTITGADHALAYLKKLEDGVRAASDQVVRIGSSLVYARGIETGHRGHRLARRAGGAFYLRSALGATSGIKAALVSALPNGGAATQGALAKQAKDIEQSAQQHAPARSGKLRASIHTVISQR